MKLTNYMRDAFATSVLNDTPHVDYSEQLRSAVEKAAVARLPAKVAALWKDPTLRDYVPRTTVYVDDGSVTVPCREDQDRGVLFREFRDALMVDVGALVAEAKAQGDARRELYSKIRGVAQSYTTRKALAEALPEFAKYLPADAAAANRSLPVVANVVADFVKAGWPKTPPRNNV